MFVVTSPQGDITSSSSSFSSIRWSGLFIEKDWPDTHDLSSEVFSLIIDVP
jgi:hypothetical protein